MFSVIFEVHPKSEQWEVYLGFAKMLRPELEKVEGFVDNIRYRSLTRDGWLLSLSGWRDEKALVRWRTKASHHHVQEQGRTVIMHDYHLRVGQLTSDSRPPPGQVLREQRLDETQVGEGTTVTLVDGKRAPEWVRGAKPEEVAEALGLPPGKPPAGLVSWDVFDAVLMPGDIILMLTWRDQSAAIGFASNANLAEGMRLRTVRVVRDYGMYDRREAPQYYPEVNRA